jgi:CBS domain-containing protein
MTSVKHLLLQKGNSVWSISPQASVFEALQLMAEKGIGALIVVENNQVVGVISERDYARKIILLGKTSKDTEIMEIMSSPVISVNLEHTVEHCMALMTEKRIRHLPVIESQQLVGLISIGDVVKSIISNQEILIDHLVSYITGSK